MQRGTAAQRVTGNEALALGRRFPWRRLTVSAPTGILAITTLLALLYFAWGINSWRFSFVGDEYAFFDAARDIIARHMLVNPLGPDGVYNMNAVLGSYYQALVMLVLGQTNTAWRLSNVLLVVPISIFFYLWLRRSFGAYTALFATITLQCSFYLANFFKIGYPNPQAFAWLAAALYAASLCGERLTYPRLIALAATLGLASYVHIGVLFPLFVWPYLLPVPREPARLRRAMGPVIVAVALYLLLVVPPFFDPLHTGSAFASIFVPRYETMIPRNLLNSLLVFYKDRPGYDHFTGGPYLDLISRLCALAGTLIALIHIRRRDYRSLLLAYASAVFAIAVSSPYSSSTDVEMTRGIYLIPFGAAFAGIALGALAGRREPATDAGEAAPEAKAWGALRPSLPARAGAAVTRVRTRAIWKRARWLLVGALLAGIAALNVYQSQVGVFTQEMPDQSAVILRLLQADHDSGARPTHRVVLLLSRGEMYNSDVTITMRHAYGLDSVPYVVLRFSRLTCADLAHGDVVVLPDDARALAVLHALRCPADTFYSLTIA